MKPINERLVELRKDYGLPQMTLAKAFGISQNAIDCYEYGTSVPHEALTKYADYFDVVLIWKFNRFALNRYDSTHYKSILHNQFAEVKGLQNIADAILAGLLIPTAKRLQTFLFIHKTSII